MITKILIVALIILLCVLLNKMTSKIGVPMLFAFILLGMAFGTDGIFKIPFDNYTLSEQICSSALIFIMFYGGFSTKWSEAKPVAVKAILLSSLGTVLTAGFVGAFCYLVLRINFLESMLLGSVISSTDAASVFSILRSKKLGLKNHTDSLLEVESGSNDPFSYMLTIIVLSVMNGKASVSTIIYMTFAQIIFGVAIGAMLSIFAVRFLQKFKFGSSTFEMLFVLAIALIGYALPATVGGNGYLSVYIVGIVLGNSRIPEKKSLVHFFDGVTGLMQILIFFLLGLLATPSTFPSIIGYAVAIILFLTFVARPISVFAILTPLKCKMPQQLLVAFSGLRGAASIVFAIMATTNEAYMKNDVFHIVFCIVLFSILFQGSLIPPVARKLDMTDKNVDVLRTFTDYSDETDLNFIQMDIVENHHWNGMTVRDLVLPPDVLLVTIIRNEEVIIPSGLTQLETGDTIVLSAAEFKDKHNIRLVEKRIMDDSDWGGKTISEYSPQSDELIVMIKRGKEALIPRGNTAIESNDILVILSSATEEFI